MHAVVVLHALSYPLACMFLKFGLESFVLWLRFLPSARDADTPLSTRTTIQFTTVISADALSTDSIVETTKTKIDEESYGYRASSEPYHASSEA